MKTKLSVNINKVASLRNARGKNVPDLISMAKIVLESKAQGITVHPRPDERHIRYQDVFDLKKLLENYPDKELNIEGYPSPKILDLIHKIQPEQYTLVPDSPEVLTSNAGWNFVQNKNQLQQIIKDLKALPCRLSLFLDPLMMNSDQLSALQEISPDRVELYTESYAESWNTKQEQNILSVYQKTAETIYKLGIKINAGHDLNQENLFSLLKSIPFIQEVSIGQALIAEALEEGLKSVIKKYLNIIDKAHKSRVS